MNYHDRPEWSQSQMKYILDHGIEWAVAAKKKIIEQEFGTAVDLGELTHMFVLGGDAKGFVVAPYEAFRTNEAKAWRDARKAEGKTIIRKNEYEAFVPIVANVKAHPRSNHLLLGDNIRHEVEMYATINGVSIRGKADALQQLSDGAVVIADLKTTTKFDEFKYKAMRRHYDLQAALYSMLACKATGASPALCNFWFCVAETVFPYRVQWHHCSTEFIEHGERKLEQCINAIKDFGDREPNFLIEEVNELGDFSL